jgi:hypothetical protein
MTHEDALDTMASERYLLGEMSELERHRFEEHYFSCPECAADVRDGALMRDATTLAFATQRHPIAAADTMHGTGAKVLSWRQRLRPAALVPLAAAATFALMAGYQSMIVIPRLQEGFAAQAIVPVVLRPAARGSEQVISISRDSAFVSLEPDLTATPSANVLTYQLKTDGGGEVLSGNAAAPTQGARLLLLVPTSKLTQPGRYTLTVHDGRADGPVLGEFSLMVERQ